MSALLFTVSSGLGFEPITYKQFCAFLVQVVSLLNLDPLLYSPHSFHRGRATFCIWLSYPLQNNQIAGGSAKWCISGLLRIISPTEAMHCKCYGTQASVSFLLLFSSNLVFFFLLFILWSLITPVWALWHSSLLFSLISVRNFFALLNKLILPKLLWRLGNAGWLRNHLLIMVN